MLHVADQTQSGHTPEEVTAQFDLTLGEVHTTLAYYHEHTKEMRDLREKIAERVREHQENAGASLDELAVELRIDRKPQIS